MDFKKKIFCDFDGVILKTDNLISLIQKQLTANDPEKIITWNVLYEQYKSDIPLLITCLSASLSVNPKIIHDLFFQTDLEPFLQNGVREFIKQRTEELTIVTQGDKRFQESKLTRLGLTGIVTEANKYKYICDQIKHTPKKQTEQLHVVIDDRLSELELVSQALPEETMRHTVFIHMPIGRHANETYQHNNNIKFETQLKSAKTFSDVESIINLPSIEPNKELYLPTKERR